MISELAIKDFVDAWNDTAGDTFAERLERNSLIALAHGNPQLTAVMAELKGGARQHLDMRLTGKQVDDHWAPAELIGKIFKDVAEAVKELSKGISGKRRGGSSLAITAPAAGSLKLSFATEPSARPLTLEEKTIGTADDQALVQLSQLFGAAAHSSDSLASVAAGLHNNAAIPVRRVTELLVKQGWCVDFTAYGPLQSKERFQLTTSSSQTLLETLHVEKRVVTPFNVEGLLDGWKWSEGSMYVIPRTGRRFSAAVPVPLQHQVARLTGEKGVEIEARFNRVETTNVNQNRAKRTSYELVHIVEAHVDNRN